MSRSGYVDDYDYDTWESIRWRGQVASATRGKRGQAFLREMIEALDAMPEPRLITSDLIRNGEVCALGSLGVRRGVDMERLDPEDYVTIADVFGVAHQLVQEVEWANDEGGLRDETPEQRWQRMRAWARNRIKETPDAAA